MEGGSASGINGSLLAIFVLIMHVLCQCYLDDSETGSDELKIGESDAESGSDSEDVASDYDQSDSSDDVITRADQSDSEVVSQEKGDEVSTGFSTISLASLQEDIEKGKAAKQQIGKSATCR